MVLMVLQLIRTTRSGCIWQPGVVPIMEKLSGEAFSCRPMADTPGRKFSPETNMSMMSPSIRPGPRFFTLAASNPRLGAQRIADAAGREFRDSILNGGTELFLTLDSRSISSSPLSEAASGTGRREEIGR